MRRIDEKLLQKQTIMTYEQFLETDDIRLRAIEPSDIDRLYSWENNTKLWRVSACITPYSRQAIVDFVENTSTDIYETRQLRLMIVNNTDNETIGTIDLFDFDAHNRHAAIGIYVIETYQQKGFATKALQLLLSYCRSMLLLHQVTAEISISNAVSLRLFQSAGFTTIGIKKDWFATENGWEDVVCLQKIL